MSPTKPNCHTLFTVSCLTYWGEVVQVPCHPSCHQQRQNCHTLFTVSCLTISPTGVKLSKIPAIHHVTNKGKTVTLSLLSVASPSHLLGWSCPSSLPSIMSPTKAKLSRFVYCQLSHRLTYRGEVVQVPCHPSCHQQRQNCHTLFTVSCLTYWGEVVQVLCHPSCYPQRQSCPGLSTASCHTH